ncbi:MAG: VWA domain-containing protein [Nitrososphaerota archaeon]|nr:VWA domain-containing protein [Nitrososphaerota archaeon]MDG6922428.1 VWA domain-containing protein [Nitrososphaerota archaeon]
MKPIDFAWGSLKSITQKEPSEIKLLVDDIEYPALETDSRGFVLHLSSPQKHRDNLYRLHGMYYDNDKRGKSSLWRMFRASVYHLCLHAVTTDYAIYKPLSDSTQSLNNLMFAISQVEDYAVRGHMSARWRGLLLDTAYANYQSSLRLRDLTHESDSSSLTAANLLSFSMTGKPLLAFGDKSDGQFHSIYRNLLEVESVAHEFYSRPNLQRSAHRPLSSSEMASAKIVTVRKILQFLKTQGCDLTEIPSPPFADNHGVNSLFSGSAEVLAYGAEDFDSVLKDISAEFSLRLTREEIAESEKSTDSESQGVLSEWEYSITSMKKLSDLHRSLDPRTHFESFLFPNEDYAEFARARSKLIGPIRLALDRLKMIRFTVDESQGKESGYVDVPIAIQVVASESKRNDVFIQEENELRSEAWAIVVDSSKSLEALQSEVRDVAVCLTEVAKDLIPNSAAWACYSFNENFYIVKDFSEIYGNAVKGRIGGLTSGLKTFLPDALRIAAKRLKATAEDVKVMLVISDGFPLGYEGIDSALLETVDNISKSGIQLIGMGIGSSSMKKYFRTTFSVSSPFDLMKNFVRTYVELSSSF